MGQPEHENQGEISRQRVHLFSGSQTLFVQILVEHDERNGHRHHHHRDALPESQTGVAALVCRTDADRNTAVQRKYLRFCAGPASTEPDSPLRRIKLHAGLAVARIQCFTAAPGAAGLMGMRCQSPL